MDVGLIKNYQKSKRFETTPNLYAASAAVNKTSTCESSLTNLRGDLYLNLLYMDASLKLAYINQLEVFFKAPGQLYNGSGI